MIVIFQGSALDSVAATLAATARGGRPDLRCTLTGPLTAALIGNLKVGNPHLVLRPCRPGSQVAAARGGQVGMGGCDRDCAYVKAMTARTRRPAAPPHPFTQESGGAPDERNHQVVPPFRVARGSSGHSPSFPQAAPEPFWRPTGRADRSRDPVSAHGLGLWPRVTPSQSASSTECPAS